MYKGLTTEICETAWGIVKLAAIAATDAGVTNKYAGTIVVLRPADGELLYRGRIDDHYPGRQQYDDMAHAKAKVSWSTGLPSRTVQQDCPYLYQPGWAKWGGAVVENKLVVAFSGVQAIFDEAIAWNMLNWVVALCQYEMTKPDGMMNDDSAFIGLLPDGSRG